MSKRVPPIEPDSVINAYRRNVDRTSIRENLKLNPEQRILKLIELPRYIRSGPATTDAVRLVLNKDDAFVFTFCGHPINRMFNTARKRARQQAADRYDKVGPCL